MGRCWWVRAWPDLDLRRIKVASKAKPGAQSPVGENSGPRGVDMKGQMHVSELISDRAAAPSPFGDDQTFPLPVERLTYKPTISIPPSSHY
jgi:hypothetical protein